MKCPHCRFENEEGAPYCIECGNDLPFSRGVPGFPGGVGGTGDALSSSDYSPLRGSSDVLSGMPEETGRTASPKYDISSQFGGYADIQRPFLPDYGEKRAGKRIPVQKSKELWTIKVITILFVAIPLGIVMILLSRYIVFKPSPYMKWSVIQLQDNENEVSSVSISPNSDFFVTSYRKGAIRIWNAKNLRCEKSIGNQLPILGITISPDGRFIASCGESRILKIWDVKTCQCLRTIEIRQGMAHAITFSPYGEAVILGGGDGLIEIWDARTGASRGFFKAHNGEINFITYSSDGKKIATCGQDGSVKIWDSRTGKCIRTIKDSSHPVYGIAFSPDRSLIAICGKDTEIGIWNVEKGECINRLIGHKKGVGDVVFSPDGKYIVSAGEDKTLRIWETRTGDCARVIKTPSHAYPLAFASNGQFIVFGRLVSVLKERKGI